MLAGRISLIFVQNQQYGEKESGSLKPAKEYIPF